MILSLRLVKCWTMVCIVVVSAEIAGAQSAPGMTVVSETNVTSGSHVNWMNKPFHHPFFVENKGQFSGKDSIPDSEILFGVDYEGVGIYYSADGLTYRFDKVTVKKKDEGGQAVTVLSPVKKESKEISHFVNFLKMRWKNANPHCAVQGEGKVLEEFSYKAVEDPSDIGTIRANGFRRIVYKELYNGIDVEYTFHPLSGTKYKFIIRPGADPAQIKMLYYHAAGIFKNATGDIHFQTEFGDIIDHAPVTFYADNETSIINSSFLLSGNEVSFQLGSYDKTQTIIIDPWVTVPVLPSIPKAFDIARDAAGNVYIYGGFTDYKVQKYSPTGVALWTYNTGYSVGACFGDLAVDAAGNSYITKGCCQGDRAKINTNGTVVWSLAGGYEYWNLIFNCGLTQLYAGGYGSSGEMWMVDLNTGAFTNLTTVAQNEVRSLCTDPAGNIYGLTANLTAVNNNRLFARTAALGSIYDINNGYSWNELGVLYTESSFSKFAGQNGIVADHCFLYTTSGSVLEKRNKSNGAIVLSAIIPGAATESNSGVAVDSCGNIYVGSQIGVHKYDNNLTLLTSITTPGAVYCVTMSAGGEVLASGNGFLASMAFSACNPVSCSASSGILLTVSTTPASCGNTNGSAAVAVTGGSPPYTYAWSNGQTTSSSTGLSAGMYTVTVSANGGCLISSAVVSIQNANGPQVTLSKSDILCNGQCTGSASASITGGSSPYTYLWNTGSTSSSISNLCAGNYTITVTDASGCTDIKTVSVGQAAFMFTILNGSNPGCNNGTGSAVAIVGGGTAPYTYLWSNGQSAQTTTGLPAGTYTLQVTDMNGCTSTASVTLTQPTAVTVSTTVIQPSCGGNNGSATAFASGGSGTYSYLWSNGAQTTAAVSGLAPGGYTVTVTDANGCSASAVISIANTNGPVTTMSQTNILCNGICTGSAVANVSGGNTPYTYSWSNTAVTSAISNVCAGSYTVTVSDAVGCTSVQTVSITQPATGVQASPTATGANCGVNDGTASANASGGSGALTYFWSPGGQTTSFITGLAATSYSVLVTDANGCTVAAVVQVNNNNGPVIANTSSSDPLCNGTSNGSASVVVSGAGLSYSWSPSGQTNAAATGLAAGTYTVVITDGSGCSVSQIFTINEPPAITTSTTSTPDTCSSSSGTAAVIATGGTGALSYAWTPGGYTVPALGGLNSGNYSVVVTDANGCTQLATINVGGNPGPTASVGADVTIIPGANTSLVASGGGAYNWSPSTGLSCTTCSNPIASPTQTTQYCVTVTDANGCTDNSCMMVTVVPPCPDNAELDLPTAFTPNNDGHNDVYLIAGLNNCIAKYSLVIFNRWGQKVFESTDLAAAWDGKLHGRALDAGVFVYYFTGIFLNGESLTKKGNISLIR